MTNKGQAELAIEGRADARSRPGKAEVFTVIRDFRRLS